MTKVVTTKFKVSKVYANRQQTKRQTVKYSYGPRLRCHYNIVLANSARYRREPVRSNSGSASQDDFARLLLATTPRTGRNARNGDYIAPHIREFEKKKSESEKNPSALYRLKLIRSVFSPTYCEINKTTSFKVILPRVYR